jgi:hypothetical protein
MPFEDVTHGFPTQKLALLCSADLGRRVAQPVENALGIPAQCSGIAGRQL